jgi:succinyl-diaminopimelate desuccinylase
MDPGEEILKAVEARQDEWVGLLTDLVRRPSPNPPGDTREAAALVAGHLERRGHRAEVIAGQPTMPNVLATLDNGAGRHLILNGHLDTFPVGHDARWTRDPFGGEVADGRIFGRGVSDMKAGVTASIAAFCLLAERRAGWTGRVTLAAVADEETMGPWGANYLVDRHPRLRGDAVLIGEPSTPRTVRFGERGMVWVRLVASGQSAHGAYPHAGSNAIFPVAAALQALRELEAAPWAVPREVTTRIDEAREATDALLGAGASDTLASVTVNAGLVRGGTKINLVADHCEPRRRARASAARRESPASTRNRVPRARPWRRAPREPTATSSRRSGVPERLEHLVGTQQVEGAVHDLDVLHGARLVDDEVRAFGVAIDGALLVRLQRTVCRQHLAAGEVG